MPCRPEWINGTHPVFNATNNPFNHTHGFNHSEGAKFNHSDGPSGPRMNFTGKSYCILLMAGPIDRQAWWLWD